MPIPKSELMRRLRERHRAERLAAMPARACEACGKPLPVAARANAKCCSAICRARLSRDTLEMVALFPAEVAELYAALDSLLAKVPIHSRKTLTRNGLRFSVTKRDAKVLVESRSRRSRLLACYAADGSARPSRKDPWFERDLHDAVCQPAY
jgi:hypothetical protein